jgi:hypothetical protein
LAEAVFTAWASVVDRSRPAGATSTPKLLAGRLELGPPVYQELLHVHTPPASSIAVLGRQVGKRLNAYSERAFGE